MRVFLFLSVSAALPAQTGWRLVWSDEFNGPVDAKPDSSKWVYELGNNNGWGNSELETYTDKTANAHLDGSGHLVIRAEHPSGNLYTSARLKTQGKFTTTYGKVEARIKLPSAHGIWPAFWMLGTIPTSWPACGEIDIMEHIGEPQKVYGTIHGPGYSGAHGIGTYYSLPSGTHFADDFHTFTVIWTQTPEQIEFFVDGHSYHKVTPANLPSGTQWVYNKPFFLLLNLAVGGRWPGNPDATTVFPQQMLVDYVRVYEQVNGAAIHAGGIVNAASFSDALAPGALGSVFGVNMATTTADNIFDAGLNAFPTTLQGTSITVNDTAAPLTYISAGQINFQIPWEIQAGTTADVRVVSNGVTSAAERVSIRLAAPSLFARESLAITNCVDGAVAPGAACTLFGNGFGPKVQAQQTGVPSPRAAINTTTDCTLTIAGIPALVTYCGVAPTLIIDQLNFVYPVGIAPGEGTVSATLTIGTETGTFALPRPVA